MCRYQGPEMRLGLFKGDKTTLVPGHEFILTTENVEGTAEKAHVNYAGLPEEVKRGTPSCSTTENCPWKSSPPRTRKSIPSW